jgi:hypothetical protein
MLKSKSTVEADELFERFSGHNLCIGYATAAAAGDAPSYRTGSTPDTVGDGQPLLREKNKWTNNGLNGVGL